MAFVKHSEDGMYAMRMATNLALTVNIGLLPRELLQNAVDAGAKTGQENL